MPWLRQLQHHQQQAKMRSMTGFFTFLLGLILALHAPAPAQAQQPPFYYYPNWMYGTPWRPLLGRSAPLDTQHLSLGYTGPQTFPAMPEQQAQTPLGTRPLLLGILLPQAQAEEQFRLPFRPSPFVGYSDDGDDNDDKGDNYEHQQQQQQHHHDHQSQHQQLQPAFHAPGYPPRTDHRDKPIEEPRVQAQTGQDHSQHYLYMTPANVYQLIRS